MQRTSQYLSEKLILILQHATDFTYPSVLVFNLVIMRCCDYHPRYLKTIEGRGDEIGSMQSVAHQAAQIFQYLCHCMLRPLLEALPVACSTIHQPSFGRENALKSVDARVVKGSVLVTHYLPMA